MPKNAKDTPKTSRQEKTRLPGTLVDAERNRAHHMHAAVLRAALCPAPDRIPGTGFDVFDARRGFPSADCFGENCGPD